MSTSLAPFLGIAALVIVTPGPDTALTIRNTLVGGRASGLATALGVAAGQAIWTLAASAGVAALLLASAPAFAAVKLLGALYLVLLGAQALRRAWRGGEAEGGMTPGGRARPLTPMAALGQGVISNLGNPKMAVFFTSLLPQFTPGAQASFVAMLSLGLLFCSMTLAWLACYAIALARAGDVLKRHRIRRWLEAAVGVALVGLGLRLAAERR